MNKFFTQWFGPKFVAYINVNTMAPKEVETYMKSVVKSMNLKRTLYIPTRNSETRFVKL